MGAVNSACEGCFGEKDDPKSSKTNQKLPRDTHKYYTPADTRVNTSDLKTSTRFQTNSLNSPNIKNRSPTSTIKSLQPSSIRLRDSQSLVPAKDKDKKLTIDDFDILKVIGKGSFGRVSLATKKGEKKYYAVKSIKKRSFATSESRKMILNEKKILQDAMHPFVVRLHSSFKDDSTLYFVMDFLPGGELLTHLKKRGVFDEETTRFYAAEIILGLQYLHEKLNVMYRDLKPENILLDEHGHAKITDFGLSTTVDRSSSFCGTLFYLAPEVILTQEDQETADQEQNSDLGYDKTVDWWSLGCLIFQLLTGYVPFDSKNHDQLQEDILQKAPFIPASFSEGAKDLILKLLSKDPKNRLGYNGAEEIKKHKFFAKTNWNAILNKTSRPPIQTNLTKAGDVRNFKEFTDQEPAQTPAGKDLLEDFGAATFEGFSYVRKEIGDMNKPGNLLAKV